MNFDEFVKAINDAILTNKNFEDDREYRIKVGEIAKEFKEAKWGKRTKDIDSKTKDWISELSSQFGESWTDVKNLSFQRITDLINGKAGVIHAHAIHYRLHAELDLPRFARRIDEFVFGGETFEQFRGHSVFSKKQSEEKRIKPTFAKVLTYPDAYQRGRKEFNAVKSAFLLPNGSQNAVSVSICGAGGYGKSYLAQEICDDEDIQKAFPGGIYWLQFSLPDNSNEKGGGVRLAEAIDRMLDAQYNKSEQPPLDWDHKNSDILKLVEILPAERVLLVADDLGTPQQLSWLSQVSAHISVLMTTRRRNVAKQAAREIAIQRLTHEASYKLLTHGMTHVSPNQQERLQKLAKGFGGWPLLLGLANGVFKQRGGDPKSRIDLSLGQFEQFLADDEIDAWDIPETDEEAIEKRQKLVGYCIEAGLRAIHPSNNPDLLRNLAIFSADADIPFSVAIDYWAKIENKRISKSRGEALLQHFADFSFFSSFNEKTQSLRVHDEILGYFRVRASEDQRRWLHGELLASIQAHCSGGWETLPHNHTYGWTQLLHHLEKANRSDEADELRTDFHWLKAKLASVGASELLRSFARGSVRNDVQLVGRAVFLSIPVIGPRPQSFAHQLFGRLSYEDDPRLVRLAQQAQSDSNCWPIPLRPHLPPIGLEIVRFHGHGDAVRGVDFNPEGKTVVSASWDKTARLWDAEAGIQIGNSLEGHSGPVCSAMFDRTGRRVVTSSFDKTARLWDVNTGIQIGEPLRGHDKAVISAVFDLSGQKILTASDDKTARIWDANTGTQIGMPLQGHSDFITSAVFDPSGKKILTASKDKTARLWNAENGTQIGKPLEGHSEAVTGAVFDPSGKIILTASKDMTARLWNVDTGKQIGEPLRGHSKSIRHAVFNADGRKIVTASNDMTARLWDADTGIQIGRPFQGHSSIVFTAIFDPSGRMVVTASLDGTARLWDSDAGTQFDKFSDVHNDAVISAVFDPIGRRAVTASWDKTARLWNVDTGTQIGRPLVGHGDRVNSAVFDASGQKIVTASNDMTARLWDANTGSPICEPLIGHSAPIRSAVFSPSGQIVLTASWDKTVRLWDADAGTQIGKPLKGHGGLVDGAVFDPSGRKILTASTDMTARLWDAYTGTEIGKPLQGHSEAVRSAVFDADGQKIVTASNDMTARLWDANTGTQIGEPLQGHSEAVRSAVFDADGRKVLTASYDGTARLWDADTGKQMGKALEGHRNPVVSAAFNADGQKVVTASLDMTIRLWDAETGKCLNIIEFDSPIFCIEWYHRNIIVGLMSGLVCLFHVG